MSEELQMEEQRLEEDAEDRLIERLIEDAEDRLIELLIEEPPEMEP